ncbi:MAG: SpoIIE family protein phosphatase [Acidobacteria bacterium]|nr:SpoIIE family protein phosphatase [Acidobacteriota bacterium]
MVEASREPGPRRRARTTPTPSQGPHQDRPRKTPAQELPATTDRLRLLEAAMQQVAEGVVVVNLEGHVLFANRAAQRIVGKGAMDAAPADWSSLYGCFLPDKVTPYPAEQLPLARALRGEPVDEEEIFIRNSHTPEGAWISVDSTPLRDGEGQLAGGVILFRDVTAHRRSREVVHQLSKAIEKTTDAVFITDVEAAIEYVNPAFETTTGYSRDEVIGKTPSILKSGQHEPGFFLELWRSILAGEVHSGTLVNRRKNGELFHAEQTITPVRDRAGNLSNFVSVMRDVTELKRGQEREIEIRLARTVQEKLYPAGPLELAGFDLVGAAVAADHTCGDYYDFVPLEDGRVAIAVGDVSGHGLSAALLMAETRAYLRSLLRSSTDLDEILRQLNVFLCDDTEDERFVTLMLAILDPARQSLVFSSAGHIPGYVLDPSGATRRALESTGMPLGLFTDAEFPASPGIPLAEGDLLLLLTDGATEAQNAAGDFFDAEGVLRTVAKARHGDSDAIIRELHSAIEDFGSHSPRRDDITAVVCKVGPRP